MVSGRIVHLAGLLLIILMLGKLTCSFKIGRLHQLGKRGLSVGNSRSSQHAKKVSCPLIASLCTILTVIEQAIPNLSTAAPGSPSNSLLYKHLVPPALHQATDRWIVFSDLHVKASSVETCEAVLNHVHDEALARDAGIIFLGDFWHVRGLLNVDLLNRVLRALEKWTKPVIMIPGNHDQVTLGGMVHALEPLMYAFRPDQALLINEPAICMNALWVPYRRDHKLMCDILQSAHNRPDISMVFCHADVRGAYMNDGMRSREGIDVDVFPKGVPIFSGHFHKPHTVSKNSVNLRYVGSPYQTSLSEADQEKYLYMLSAEADASDSVRKWKEAERWPIHFGRKYYRMQGVADAKLAHVSAGDRVVLSVTSQQASAADTLAQSLREKGVEVEIRTEQMTINKPSTALSSAAEGALDPSLSSADSLTPLQSAKPVWDTNSTDMHKLFGNYVSSLTLESLQQQSKAAAHMKDEELFAVRKQALLQEAMPLLDKVIDTVPSLHRLRSSEAALEVKNVALSEVSLSNFGPYGGDVVHYPLDKRGLVLIQGRVEDDTGADSNGSGKTTLAMSVMWCLTGSMDTRLIADARSADVAFDSYATDDATKNKRIAEVRLAGHINGKPFDITRRKGQKKSELLFALDGKDVTTLSIKDTQALIEETLGTGNGLLQRCCFYGQHSHTQQSLLGLQDSKLKDELSKLVDVTVWVEAAKETKLREKANQERLQEINFIMKMKQAELTAATSAITAAQGEVQTIQIEMSKLEEQMQSNNNKHDEVALSFNETERALQAADESRQKAKAKVDPLRQQLFKHMESNNTMTPINNAFNDMKIRMGQHSVHLNNTNTNLKQWKKKMDTARVQISKVQRSIDELLIEWADDHRLEGSCDVSTLPHRLAGWKADVEVNTAKLGALDAKIDASNSTYQQLRVLSHLIHHEHTNSSAAAAPDVLAEDACPTCGQDMPSEDRLVRMETVKVELQGLLQARQEAWNIQALAKNASEKAHNMLALVEQMKPLETQCGEFNLEMEALEQVVLQTQQSIGKLDAEMKAKKDEEAAVAQKMDSDKLHLQTALNESQLACENAENAWKKLSEQHEVLRKEKNYFAKLQSDHNYSVGLLQNKLSYASKTLQEKKRVAGDLDTILAGCVEEKAKLTELSSVFDQLGGLFGTRGIQNFLFSGALAHLEDTSNRYLSVLAEGGMQLAMRSDEDGERILKTVLMRASPVDGTVYKERALSLLSGGQWRRVSLALDLAFTDMVRSKGLLRCNLLVMDEVLSHLDAQGREAVGSVLRALVAQSPTGSSKTSRGRMALDDVQVIDTQPIAKGDLEPGRDDYLAQLEVDRYDTILVILQDIVAAELEEAFDHIDTVIKRGEVSRVEIDG